MEIAYRCMVCDDYAMDRWYELTYVIVRVGIPGEDRRSGRVCGGPCLEKAARELYSRPPNYEQAKAPGVSVPGA